MIVSLRSQMIVLLRSQDDRVAGDQRDGLTLASHSVEGRGWNSAVSNRLTYVISYFVFVDRGPRPFQLQNTQHVSCAGEGIISHYIAIFKTNLGSKSALSSMCLELRYVTFSAYNQKKFSFEEL